MLAEDIIVPVTEPTEWVNSIVCHVTEKPDGTKVILCLDPKDQKTFHVEMDYESSLLFTFNTPFGRFITKRLPFGVKIVQAIFQCRLDKILK